MHGKFETEDDRWIYNAKDCIVTRECGEVEIANLKQMGLQAPDAFQQRLLYPVLEAMCRGVKIDKKVRADFALELEEEITKREGYFVEVLGHPLNPRSPLQMTKLFYEDPRSTRGHVSTEEEQPCTSFVRC